jgi:hypothetical protein
MALLVVLIMKFVQFDIDYGAPIETPRKPFASQPKLTLDRSFAADSGWEILWIVGRDKTSGVFAEPRQIIANEDRVVVLDGGTREVRVLDLTTGNIRLTKPATGVGPGEFKRPALLAQSPRGFAILDHASGRLSSFSLDGDLLWDIPLPDMFELAGICIPNEESVIVQYNRLHDNVVHLDTAGRRLVTKFVPWTNMEREVVLVGLTGFMSNAAHSGGCAFAPLYGSEWVHQPANSDAPPTVHAFVEPGEDPVFETTERLLAKDGSKVDVELTQRTVAPVVAQGVQAIHDTVVINAWTTKQCPRRILDYHHLPSGRYLYSRVLPFVVNGFAIAPDGTFIVSHIGDTDQIVMAMRPVARPDSLSKSGQKNSVTPTPPASTPARPPAPVRARPPANR